MVKVRERDETSFGFVVPKSSRIKKRGTRVKTSFISVMVHNAELKEKCEEQEVKEREAHAIAATTFAGD